MTKSINLEFGDWSTPIVESNTISIDDYQYKQQRSTREVIIVNTSNVNLYLGDELAYDNGWGVPVLPGTGISISLGHGDRLYGYADDYITLPIMILAGKGR
jgi:hypothetical protein